MVESSSMHRMSAKNKGSMIWSRNRKWYRIDKERQRFVLTDEAPQEARDSFEQYKKINNLKWDD